MRELSVVVTCMGRLPFLQATLPLMLQGADHVCVVDYSCPQRSGDWAERAYGSSGKLWVGRVPGQRLFNKSRANNAGAAAVRRLGLGGSLVFLDADTIAPLPFWDWVRQATRPECFYFVESYWHASELTGVLVVDAARFHSSGGFDERMRGWGVEDVDMRFRLALKEGMCFDEIPADLLRSIPHANALRSENYHCDHLGRTMYENGLRLAENVRCWVGGRARDIDPVQAARLLTACRQGPVFAYTSMYDFWRRVGLAEQESEVAALQTGHCWYQGRKAELRVAP